MSKGHACAIPAPYIYIVFVFVGMGGYVIISVLYQHAPDSKKQVYLALYTHMSFVCMYILMGGPDNVGPLTAGGL